MKIILILFHFLIKICGSGVCSLVNVDQQYLRPIVNLTTGQIEGRFLTTASGRKTFVFQGIPYAEPPTGELRFRKPVPKAPWNGTLICQGYKAACPQNISLSQYAEQSEDCLFMNVFAGIQCSQANPCPVLYYIHGGANEFESPSMFPEEDLVNNIASNGIVMVSVAYRLGVLGFFSTGTQQAVGNWAIEDMIEGARWVQREVHNFGGAKNTVTVMGHSSSADIVSLLTMSEKTMGLFHRAVIMSGSGTHWNAISNDITDYLRLSEVVGCGSLHQNGKNETDLLICMRKIPAEILVNIFNDLRSIDEDGIFPRNLTAVRNDGPDGLFPKPLAEMIQNRRPIDTMTGTTKNEGGLQKISLIRATPTTVADLCSHTVEKRGDISGKREVVRECVKDYVYHANLSQFSDAFFPPWTEQAVELTDDADYFAPCFKECDSLRSKGAKVYLYSFDYEKRKLEGIYPWHAADLSFVLGSHKLKFDSRDYQIQSRYAPLFVNFIKYGNPTPEPVDDVIWEPLPKSSKYFGNYLSVDIPVRMKPDYHKTGVLFWNSKVPAIEAGGFNKTKDHQNLSALPFFGDKNGPNFWQTFLSPTNFMFQRNDEYDEEENNITDTFDFQNGQKMVDHGASRASSGTILTLVFLTVGMGVVLVICSVWCGVNKIRRPEFEDRRPLFERYSSYNSF